MNLRIVKQRPIWCYTVDFTDDAENGTVHSATWMGTTGMELKRWNAHSITGNGVCVRSM
jgi:hypothetical protein